jgi:hypothetical protein
VRRTSVLLISVAFAVATLFAGLVGLTQRSNRFHAEARIAVAPVNPVDAAVGQLDIVVSTFAQAYAGNEVVRSALEANGFAADEIARVSVTSQVLAGTGVVVIDGASKDPVLAERAADAVAGAEVNLGGLNEAYETSLLSKATGTAKRSGASNAALVLVAMISAVIAGLLAATVLRRIPPREPPGPVTETSLSPPVASPR